MSKKPAQEIDPIAPTLPAVTTDHPFPELHHGIVITDDLCRICIPKRLREKLGIYPGTLVHTAAINGAVLLATSEQIEELGGTFYSSKLDSLGRFVIPAQFRTMLAVSTGSYIQLVQRAGLPYLFAEPYYPMNSILPHINAAEIINHTYINCEKTRDTGLEINEHLKAIIKLLQQN